MLKEITIKNFKSIAEDTIALGRVNVFIGENGCGKSNILEAVAYWSAKHEHRLENEGLISKGVRVAKPSLVISSFKGGKKINNNFVVKINYKREYHYKQTLEFFPMMLDDIHTKWKCNGVAVTYSDEDTQTEKERQRLNNLLAEKGFPPSEKLELDVVLSEDEKYLNFAASFLIYCLNTPALRGLTSQSNKEPVGIHGENLDVLIANFSKEEKKQLAAYNYLIGWLETFLIDESDHLKLQGYKLNRSRSTLYFADKYMQRKNNVFSSENANEGILHVLFYLAVLISRRTPQFFAIDNIESCLNPHLCRHLMTAICKLAKENNKQLLITTHNPAILDGLNLFDDEIRLFEVFRNKNGHTKTRRILVKPEHEEKEGRKLKLSELWTRGYLGAISQDF